MMFDIPTISDSFNTWHRIRAPTISRGLLDEWPNRHNVGRPCWVLMKVFFSLMLLITWSSAISCIAAIVHGPNVAHECDFLPLCTCTHSMVTCVGVPIFTLKDVFLRREFLARRRSFNQAVISRSSLLRLEWAPSQLVTLSLPKNSIFEIQSDALVACADTLSSLDLSDNFLGDIPDLSAMRGLRWLNLQHNQLAELPAGIALTNLSTLLLAGNQIRSVSPDLLPESLATLDLESNQILSLEGHPFPSAIKQINLGTNLFRYLPHSFHRMHALERLSLNNNAFHDIPARWKLPPSLQVLDISRSSLRQLRGVCLVLENGSCHHLQILHLEFNLISSLAENLFEGMRLRKLFLNSNRLIQLPLGLFKGVISSTLTVLDVSDNQFESLPSCISSLSALSVLIARGNQLVSFDLPAGPTMPKFFRTLQVLDLSYNQFTEVSSALMNTTGLVKLSLQGNLIEKLGPFGQGQWAAGLRSVSLSHNAIKILARAAMAKLFELKELKLSFNPIHYFDNAAFTPLKNLQTLEMSSSLVSDAAVKNVHNLFKPLEQLRSLQIDYNRLHQDPFGLGPSLVNIDLEGNDLNTVPAIPPSSRITRLSLSYNGIYYLKTGALRNISTLEQIILLGNPLREVEFCAMSDLPLLVSVTLSSNRLRSVRRGAFQALPALQRLQLDNNLLGQLDLGMLDRAGRRLLLNASNNAIVDITAASDAVDVRVLDISNNKLEVLPETLWDSANELVQLSVAKNSIRQIAIGRTALERLLTADLSHNRLTAQAVYNLSQIAPSLQVLSLRGNRLETLASPERTALDYVSKWPLRVLDISSNDIRHLGQRIFEPCLPLTLQVLNISYNPLESLNLLKLANLVNLDISYTHLNLASNGRHSRLSLTSTAWNSTSQPAGLYQPGSTSLSNILTHIESLQVLNISGTRTKELSSTLLPAGLLVLEASNCALQSLHLSAESLVELKISNNTSVALARSSVLTPRLRLLDVAHSGIRNLTNLLKVFSTERLRRLRAEHNLIDKISSSLWRQTPLLTTLEINSNPVEALSLHSFCGLSHLAELDIRNLSLTQLDSRTLHHLPSLSTLYISTYNRGIRSLRLQELLSDSGHLRRAVIEVGEPVLSYQLQWAFTGKSKLRELHVTGLPLRFILPDAFQGLESAHELLLRITHTSITDLPAGLLRYLGNVRFLALDLRSNQLQTI
ncbi:protein artichoke-like isoform X1 [Varroa destructor]|uniref:Chaoptin n=2 Tax=Varroa destructor TaxID=109461 RepID=A0A7M7KPZ8_VARDE|nr:protein artichoke-like isoform X1 [Varroa destructor]XP_022664246.1 protein artichoke-like isoform X1 [Varroa destructor]